MKTFVSSLAACILISAGARAQSYTNHIIGGPPSGTPEDIVNSIASQFNRGSNTLSEVLTNVPDGTRVYRYTPGVGFGLGAQYMQGVGWFDNDFPGGTGGPTNGPVLAPGQGAYLVNGGAVPFDLVFSGTSNSPVLPLSLSCGQSYFVNRQTAGIGTYENITGQSPGDGAQLFIPRPGMALFDVNSLQQGDYDVYTFCGGGWVPYVPNVPVGISVFVTQPCPSNTNANGQPCIVLTQPDILVTSATPIEVDYQPAFHDNCIDGSVYVFCRPPSATIFSPGTTRVHGVAVDNLGDAGSCDFNVTVAPPPVPLPIKTSQVIAHPGLTLFAYQFNNGGNTLREIMTNVPDGSVVSKYNNATSSWLQSTYDAAMNAWVPPNITLRPGEGAFYLNPGSADVPLNFIGNPNLPVLPVPITNGIALLSRQTNGVGNYTNITGGNPQKGAKVFQWNGSGYDQYNYDGVAWSPVEPTAAIGESLWISPFGLGPPPPIPPAPLITQQPNPVTVPVGVSTANFVVQASGQPPLKYQWRLNANPINGATNPTFSIVNVGLSNSGNYDVLVQNSIGIAQSITVPLTFLNAQKLPFSDAFAAAGSLPSASSGIGVGSNVNATVENNEPSPGFIPGGASVWVKWQAPSNGPVTFYTTGSGFDTLLAIYTGISVTNLTPIASDDDSSTALCSVAEFNAQAGVNYYIQVDGFYGATGNIVLGWNELPTTNKYPVITAQPQSQTVGFNGSAQFSVTIQPGLIVRYEWFVNGQQISAANTSVLNITNIDASKVGIYQAKIISATSALSVLSLPVELQINAAASGIPPNAQARAEDKLQAVMDTTVRPNDPYDPPIVTGYSGVEVFSTYGSTVEPAEPLHCGYTCFFTKWHSYMAPADGLIYVANAGTTFSGVLGVYTGPDFSLVPLACSAGHAAGTEVVSFQGASNTTYWISMSGTNSSTSGTVQLQYATYTAPFYTLLPVSQTETPGSTVTLSVATTGNPSAAYQWQLNGTNIPGATSSTLTLNSFSSLNEGDYTVYAKNLAGTNFFSLAPIFLNNPPRFINLAHSPGAMFAQFLGIANSNYVFQSSTDLVHWVTTQSFNTASGVMNFSAAVNTNSPALLYRGVLPGPVP